MKCVWGTGWSQVTWNRGHWFRGGRGQQIGKGGWKCHGVKDLESQANESGLNPEDHET